MEHRILVEHVYPPIPDRSYDYCAIFDGYEPGDPQGYGPTPEAAIHDLMDSAAECELCGDEAAPGYSFCMRCQLGIDTKAGAA